jgi:hypothetical protein
MDCFSIAAKSAPPPAPDSCTFPPPASSDIARIWAKTWFIFISLMGVSSYDLSMEAQNLKHF